MGKISTEEVIRRCKIKHGDKYDYSETKYMGDSVKMIVICPQHGKFLINPYKHFKEGKGCKECGYIKMAENRRSRILGEKYEGIIQPEDYKILVLTKGKVSKVDNEDFERLKNICWKISTDGYGKHYHGQFAKLNEIIYAREETNLQSK